MMAILRVVLLALVLVIGWVVLVFLGTVEGWRRQPLAPGGDTARFMAAARQFVNANNRGNAVFALIDRGTVHAVHSVSIGEPVDADTVFQTASLSKWVTAWGVMALVEAGQIDLDAPIEKYLTRWRLPATQFANSQVTTRRLLSHTAGLTDGLGYAGFAPGATVQTLDESLRRPSDPSPGAGAIQVGLEPGSQWKYSGGGYAILQLLIEERSGESFDAYMQRAILRPLGMRASSYTWPRADGAASTLAAFYDAQGQPAIHYRFAAPAAASLYTSVSDLTTFVQANLTGPSGEPAGRGVLQPGTILEMWRPHASEFGEDIWGLGTMLYARNNAGGFVVGHDGNNEPAINTAARVNPATGNGIVVLETGSPLLATQLAGEWVFWETGNVDILMVSMAAPRMFRLMAQGSAAIVLAVVLYAWVKARRRRRTAGLAPAGS